ncbi:hypothetical protein C8Q73DRAFT_278297 [Cubamyces lactineus]|nr:hypothetical protein C8Q73DRAFT_278297 [Cubamyces lactineus]
MPRRFKDTRNPRAVYVGRAFYRPLAATRWWISSPPPRPRRRDCAIDVRISVVARTITPGIRHAAQGSKRETVIALSVISEERDRPVGLHSRCYLSWMHHSRSLPVDSSNTPSAHLAATGARQSAAGMHRLETFVSIRGNSSKARGRSRYLDVGPILPYLGRTVPGVSSLTDALFIFETAIRGKDAFCPTRPTDRLAARGKGSRKNAVMKASVVRSRLPDPQTKQTWSRLGSYSGYVHGQTGNTSDYGVSEDRQSPLCETLHEPGEFSRLDAGLTYSDLLRRKPGSDELDT